MYGKKENHSRTPHKLTAVRANNDTFSRWLTIWAACERQGTQNCTHLEVGPLWRDYTPVPCTELWTLLTCASSSVSVEYWLWSKLNIFCSKLNSVMPCCQGRVTPVIISYYSFLTRHTCFVLMQTTNTKYIKKRMGHFSYWAEKTILKKTPLPNKTNSNNPNLVLFACFKHKAPFCLSTDTALRENRSSNNLISPKLNILLYYILWDDITSYDM